MRQTIDHLLAELRAEILEGRADDGTHARLQERMAALPVLTDADLQAQIELPARAIAVMQAALAEVLGAQAAQEAGFDVLEAQARKLVVDQFGHEHTPFLQSRRIIARLAASLAEGGDAVEAVRETRDALAAIDELADVWRAQANFAIDSLTVWAGWQVMRRDTAATGLHANTIAPWLQVEQSLAETGPTRAWIDDAAAHVRAAWPECDAPAGTHTDAESAEQTVLLAQSIAGFVLVRRPDCLPGLELLRSLALQAGAVVSSLRKTAAEGSTPTLSQRCQSVLDAFDERVTREGFSQYAMEQAIAALQELPTNANSNDKDVLIDAMLALVDRSLPLAPPDACGALAALRETLVQMRGAGPEALDEAGFIAEGEAIIARLEAALAAGEEPGGVITRALGALQLLGTRVPEDGDACAEAMIAWMPRVMALAAAAAPPERRALAEQLNAEVAGVFEGAGRMLHTEGPALDIEAAAADAAGDRLAALSSTAQADAHHWDDPVLQQVMASLRAWWPRLAAVAVRNESDDSFDAREHQRLRDRVKLATTRARSITHEPQLIEQLRLSLRPLALDLRAFEQRRHLTLAEPPFSVLPVVPEADAVFVAGSPEVQALVDRAAARLGMTAPQRAAASDPTEARWLQLRAAAVAVFDFSAYDRARSDPAQVPPRGSAEEEAVLAAAAPVARVAFEAGWAWLLGVPMVVVARAGQTLPFDIDLEAVHLADDDLNADRIGAALVRVLFSPARGASHDGLAHTLAALRARLAAVPAATRVLATVQHTGDALGLRHAAEVALHAASPASPKALLVRPAMAPQPPSASAELFHVTAFRDWTKPVSQLLRRACDSSGLRYRIGHEDLDPQVLRAVWAGLFQASRVVVDLTMLNPNAAWELAVAQALGRPVLILSRHGDLGRHLPHLCTTRVHAYGIDKTALRALAGLVGRFLRDGQ